MTDITVTSSDTTISVDLNATTSASDLTTGTLASARGGTGVSNAGTLTNASDTTITGGGTIALGGFTFTVPATGSAALLATANTLTATQTIDLGTGSLPTIASANTQLRLAGTDGQATRIESLGFGGTALQFNIRLANGTRVAKTYPGTAFVGQRVAVSAWDEATLGYSSTLARYDIISTEAHTASAKGFGHQWTATLRGASAVSGGLWLEGTNTTDPFPTLSVGTAPTAGNGLLQLASGATKAYGVALGTDTFLYRSAANTVETEGALLSKGPTSGIGYSTGSGGTVTQSTSKSTGVTLSKVCGTITMNGASLAANTSVAFTLTNTAIASTDMIVCVHDSVGTLGAYGVVATPGSGSATVTVRNNTGGALAEAIVLRLFVLKGVTA